MKAPKKACKGCDYCTPNYGNFDKTGKRTPSHYWCIKQSRKCPDPKKCEFRKEKNQYD